MVLSLSVYELNNGKKPLKTTCFCHICYSAIIFSRTGRKLCCCSGSYNRRKPASPPRSLYTHPPQAGLLSEPRSANPDTEGSAPMLLQSMEPNAPPAAPATVPPTAPPYDHTILEPPPPYTE